MPSLQKARAASIRAKQKISEMAKDEGSAEEPPSDAASQWTDGTSMAASAAKQVAADLKMKKDQLERTNNMLLLAEKKCAALESKIRASFVAIVPQPEGRLSNCNF